MLPPLLVAIRIEKTRLFGLVVYSLAFTILWACPRTLTRFLARNDPHRLIELFNGLLDARELTYPEDAAASTVSMESDGSRERHD